MTTTTESQKQIAIWLLVCCATVFAMIVLGGATRLTGSGLSMVEWEPLMGVLPPLNDQQWQETFVLYQQYPEYKLKNYTMTVNEFKSIFWFEYAHRLLGRTIGIIFLIPFLFFLASGKISKALAPKLIIMFVLGGLQGLMGWYMVKSGLVDDPHVSQYRLTAHLSLAIIIYAYMFWVALDLLSPNKNSAIINGNNKVKNYSFLITFLIFFTILTGGFVAGTRAGFAFNTFPLMDGKFIPDGLFHLEPAWLNFFENIAAIQFNHRLMAMMLAVFILLFWLKTIKIAKSGLLKSGLHLLLAALILQITLGISTLLLVVPVTLATAHQGGAIVLLTASLFVSHQLHNQT